MNQPTEKSVAQVTHSLPLAQMKWKDERKKEDFLIDSGCSEAKFNQGKGDLLFLTLSHPIKI